MKIVHEEKEGSGQMEGENNEKILIADDEKDLVAMLAYNLGKKGYQIVTAYNGLEAWEKIESDKPDFLILDLMMPELDGWELCRMIRRHPCDKTGGMAILMLTARAMPEDRVYGLETGADDYLTKPFSLNELILRVEKLIEKKRDVRQLKAKMDSLYSSVRKKETNLIRVVHDLKNPLLSIGASAKRMLRRSRNEDESIILKNIYDSSLRLTGWIDETLSPDKSEVEIKEVDIQLIIRQVINLLNESNEKKGVQIHFDPLPFLPPIFCHEQLIFRTIENLLNNALKYTPGDGRIDIMITPYLQWKEREFIEISVKDTGIGIPEDEIDRIFEPFYRGRNNSSQTGAGLGLSLSKQVVENHGGRILVQSEPQKGSTFSILLPVKTKVSRERGLQPVF